jgi:hypothetical protein
VKRWVGLVLGLVIGCCCDAFAANQGDGVVFDQGRLGYKRAAAEVLSATYGPVVFAWCPSKVPSGQFAGRSCYFFFWKQGIPPQFPENSDGLRQLIHAIVDTVEHCGNCTGPVQYEISIGGRVQ